MGKSTKNQIGGSAGRWTGPGNVYLAEQPEGRKRKSKLVKIGCSKDLKRRLKQIQRTERNPGIKYMASMKANQMRRAETAAQKALANKGCVKDKTRGGATDWFRCSLPREKIKKTARRAVYRDNRSRKRK